MPRMAHVVLPGYPHHVTQRGNRRQKVFFQHQDWITYLEGVGTACAEVSTSILAYCLMPNHVHFILGPSPLLFVVSSVTDRGSPDHSSDESSPVFGNSRVVTSICSRSSSSFFGWMPISVNLRAPGSSLCSSEPIAWL